LHLLHLLASTEPALSCVGDPADAGVSSDLVFAAGGVAADGLVAAFVEDGHGGEPGWVVLVGLHDDGRVVRVVQFADQVEQASSDGSSMWWPFSLLAQ
jgi:hypothetical protein